MLLSVLLLLLKFLSVALREKMSVDRGRTQQTPMKSSSTCLQLQHRPRQSGMRVILPLLHHLMPLLQFELVFILLQLHGFPAEF